MAESTAYVLTTDGSTPIRPRRVFEENMTCLQEVTNGSSHEQVSYMSLNVLAQVATDKLRDDLKLQQKISKKSIQCLEILNLEQIQSLSNKALLNYFSEMTCNEMTKNFTYQCYLMPDRCQENFTSFGHETKAKLHMQTHLTNHIEQLIQEANDPQRQYRFIFTAEPVHVRNRKLTIKEAEKAKKKKSVSTNNSPINGSNASRVKNNKSFTALKSNKEISQENKAPAPKIIEAEKDLQLPKTCVSRQKNSKICDPTVKFHIIKKNIPPHRYNTRQNPKETLNCRKRLVNKKSFCTDNIKPAEDAESRGKVTEHSDEKNKETDSYMQIKGNELFVIDLLNKNQPYHDHCYTTIFGKKRPLETAPEKEEPEGDNDDQADNIQKRTKKTIAILELGAKCENGYMVASEEIVSSDGKPNEYQSMEAAQPGTSGEQNGNIVAAVHCGQKPYPPMPKSELAKKGKMNIPEEYEEPNSDAEEPTTSRRTKDSEKSSSELERKIAVRCIRELKNRKKDDKIPLVCQICCDKTFTASATLMYHYRSHAGIKPFKCVLCLTTFTRQHSLNYHMLIHNNQSRFTCADCGRKFRHPSHFKEHLRRHTGETPFTCGDCTQKFKTRNTYKRHLKTRHGKLLTANGISTLSNEEFQKVRTKPYKKFNNVKENEPSVQLPSPPDVSPGSIKCERSNLPTTFTTTSTITTFASSTSIVTTTSTSTCTMTPTASTSTGNSMYVPIEIIVKN